MGSDLSIVIPTYKRQDSLIKLLDLLQKQIGVNQEVIVIDQNPVGFFNENTLDILKSVKHIRLEQPNASTARNIGFLNSTSPIVLFIDDDLMPEANFCKRAIDIFNTYPEIDSLAPLVYNHLGKKNALQIIDDRKRFIHKSNQNLICIREIISAAIFFRSDVFKQTGGFDEYLFEYAKTAEDQEFFLRILKKGINVWCATDIDIFHDEGIEGGCELRTDNYWKTREKCIKSWTYRHRIHNETIGNLSLISIFKLSRSAFLNRKSFTSGLHNFMRQVKLLVFAIRGTRRAVSTKETFYRKHDYSFLLKEFNEKSNL